MFVEMSYAALYFILVAFIAALVGQYFLKKIMILFGRASIIIFILASIIFISAILLGKRANFPILVLIFIYTSLKLFFLGTYLQT